MYFVSVTEIKVDIVEIDSYCEDFRAFLHIIISYFAKNFINSCFHCSYVVYIEINVEKSVIQKGT